jgi:hypothetical protein
VILAEFTIGNALVTTLSIFFFVIWIWILIVILTDVFGDHDLSGWAKAAWVFALIFIPFLSALIYLIARGSGMAARAAKRQGEQQRQFDTYVKETASAGSSADELHKLSDLKEKGAITDEEFAAAKAKILSA